MFIYIAVFMYCYAFDISRGETGVEPPYIKYVLSLCLHKYGGAVQTELSAKAPHSKRQCGALFAWGAASQSAPLLVTFGVKSDMQRIIVLLQIIRPVRAVRAKP